MELHSSIVAGQPLPGKDNTSPTQYDQLKYSKESEESQTDQLTSDTEGASLLKCILAALAFALVSTSMAFTDKALLNTFNYNVPYFIMSCQMMFTIVLLEGLRAVQWIDVKAYSLEQGLAFVVPSTCYWINAVLSLIALSGMNIPMFGVVRRCEPLALLFLSVIIAKKGWPSPLSVLAIIFITFGCIIAGYGDLEMNIYAYGCGIGSIFTQAMYLIMVERLCKSQMSVSETLYLNSYNTLPFLLSFMVLTAEHHHIGQYAGYSDIKFIILFFSVISFGCLLNFTMFLCTSVNSALTTSVVGTLKSVAQSVLGLYTFGGMVVNVYTGFGMAINLVGGFLYTYAKYREQESGIIGALEVEVATDSASRSQSSDEDDTVKDTKSYPIDNPPLRTRKISESTGC